jgi:hypothetical protein
MSNSLFPRDLELQYWREAVSPRFVLRRSEELLTWMWVKDNPHPLEVAAKLQRFAKKVAKRFCGNHDIYVHRECREIVNLPEFLTLEFFEEGE